MKPRPRILAVILLAIIAILLFPGCASAPRWNASVEGTYGGVGYAATYDGKTIRTGLKLP